MMGCACLGSLTTNVTLQVLRCPLAQVRLVPNAAIGSQCGKSAEDARYLGSVSHGLGKGLGQAGRSQPCHSR